MQGATVVSGVMSSSTQLQGAAGVAHELLLLLLLL
jgi:hypothetical protein